MQLNEESTSAIAEIGNLCIAGGSNKISAFSDEIIDISVVQAEIRSTQEIFMEINPSDDCKLLIGAPLSGDVQGKFLVQMSEFLVNDMLSRFPKLPSVLSGKNNRDAAVEFVSQFFTGFIEGMSGMTGLNLQVGGETKIYSDLDISSFPEQVLCYTSMIFIGDDRLDFNVYFFSDANLIIPKVLESLGLS